MRVQGLDQCASRGLSNSGTSEGGFGLYMPFSLYIVTRSGCSYIFLLNTSYPQKQNPKPESLTLLYFRNHSSHTPNPCSTPFFVTRKNHFKVPVKILNPMHSEAGPKGPRCCYGGDLPKSTLGSRVWGLGLRVSV